jgi:hypothetical protein
MVNLFLFFSSGGGGNTNATIRARRKRVPIWSADQFQPAGHMPVNAIRGQTGMSDPGKTHLQRRSHRDPPPAASDIPGQNKAA